MRDIALTVTRQPTRKLAFHVVVNDGIGASRHRVTLGPDDAARFAKLGAEPAQCVEAAMRFLLDREPKDSILAAFDIAVVRRYFPEFDQAFPGYLASHGGGSARGA